MATRGMHNTLWPVIVAAAALMFFLQPAQAQGLVRYVATYGNDSNPCTRTQPCRTLQRGHNLTPAGGELQILDSGEYSGGITVSKSITVSAKGVSATITDSVGVVGVRIAGPAEKVVLRGLLFQTQVEVSGASPVHFVECTFELGLMQSSGRSITVTDSVFPSDGGLTARSYVTVNGTRFDGGGSLILFGTTAATIVDSVFTNTLDYGIYQNGARGVLIARTIISGSQHGVYLIANSKAVLERSVIRGNSAAGLSTIFGFGSAMAYVSGSMFTNNAAGIWNDVVVETRGNNTMSGNGTDVSGNALVPFAPM